MIQRTPTSMGCCPSFGNYSAPQSFGNPMMQMMQLLMRLMANVMNSPFMNGAQSCAMGTGSPGFGQEGQRGCGVGESLGQFLGDSQESARQPRVRVRPARQRPRVRARAPQTSERPTRVRATRDPQVEVRPRRARSRQGPRTHERPRASRPPVATQPAGPTARGGRAAVDSARQYLGRRSWEVRGEMPNFRAAGGRTNNCADFVSAALENGGMLGGHEVNVGRLERRLEREGWERIPASEAGPGDVAFTASRRHVELCQGEGMTIGSNNVRQGVQHITERRLRPEMVVYRRR